MKNKLLITLLATLITTVANASWVEYCTYWPVPGSNTCPQTSGECNGQLCSIQMNPRGACRTNVWYCSNSGGDDVDIDVIIGGECTQVAAGAGNCLCEGDVDTTITGTSNC